MRASTTTTMVYAARGDSVTVSDCARGGADGGSAPRGGPLGWPSWRWRCASAGPPLATDRFRWRCAPDC